MRPGDRVLAGLRGLTFRLTRTTLRETTMKVYLISMGAGVLIGLVYALLKVRSPAPPAIALIGLLGMLAGEQLISQVARHAAAATPGSHSVGAQPPR